MTNTSSIDRHDFLDIVLSWSLADILDKDLYRSQVEVIPLTFSSTTHYMNSFIFPLLEEVHAALLSEIAGISQAQASLISALWLQKWEDEKKRLYHLTLTTKSYSPKVGDLIAFTQFKPKCIDDLDRPWSPFFIAFVNGFANKNRATIEILSSNLINSHSVATKSFAVYLTNLTTDMRTLRALNPSGNMNVIQRALSVSHPETRNCDQCSIEEENDFIGSDLRQPFDSFKLNASQEAAVLTSLAANKCIHRNFIKLIWGPPGTGKTKTIVSLLFVLLRMKHRTVTSAPTNIAVVGVVKRLLSLVRDHNLGCGNYGLGDILLFGNQGRMDINGDHKDLHDVFLHYRIDALLDCLTLWTDSLNNMIRFLGSPTQSYSSIGEIFCALRERLMSCIRSMLTHLPTSALSLDYANKMYYTVDLLQRFDDLLKVVTANEIQSEAFLSIRDCLLQALKDLQAESCIPKSLTRVLKLDRRQDHVKRAVQRFCLRKASLFFCTASSSIKLCKSQMRPIEFVLIDEAAQLKECESVILLTLPGVRNVVLVGDERQLPSMVQSKICGEAKFGRSLFERLVLLGHEKHLLNVQYRMHPTISRFPNLEFYEGKIVDGFNVIDRAREKHFLTGEMYGSYSFINVDPADEEHDRNNSTKNMLEVAVITEIVANLFQESVARKQKVTVGCLSPYKAQVEAIEQSLGQKYNQKENGSYFTVDVRSIDGFQGGEEDIIIFSTVRCNRRGSVGFLASRERTNVALTRARHAMWIVGNKETMIKSGSVWNTLVSDAENRGCIYNASDDKNLGNAIMHAMIELGHFGSLLKTNSILFKGSKWKVNFTNTFFESISHITNLCVRKLVISLVVKLSSGWRDLRENSTNKYFGTQGIGNLLEIYRVDRQVDRQLYLVWSVDVVYENSLCIQNLIFWDIIHLSQIQERALCLERVFRNYSLDTINRCQTKRFERNQVLPVTWSLESKHDLIS